MSAGRVFAAIAAFAASADAFLAGGGVAQSATRSSGMRMAIAEPTNPAMDVLIKAAPTGPTVPDLLIKTEQLKILSQASKLGLLSKLEKAGLTLKDVEKLLPLVDQYDVIGTASAYGDDILKVAPAALDAAPSLLPLAALALSIPPTTLYAGALASLAAGYAAISVIPDDSVANIALQTFVAIPLLAVVPAASIIGAIILGKAQDGTLVSSLPWGMLADSPVTKAVAAPVKAVVAPKAAAPKTMKAKVVVKATPKPAAVKAALMTPPKAAPKKAPVLKAPAAKAAPKKAPVLKAPAAKAVAKAVPAPVKKLVTAPLKSAPAKSLGSLANIPKAIKK